MERFVWKGRVAQGKLAEYTKKHLEIWPEMEELMRRAGMRDYSIWHCGGELIGYYEYLGTERKSAVYEANRDILDRWSRNMAGLMEMDRDADGNVKNWAMVWLME